MGAVNLLLIAKVLFLLVMANGAPVIGKKILGEKMAFPIDGGLILSDGQPLFGKSKTIRGVVLALLVTTMLAPLVNLEFINGAMISAAAMIGDLLSSFLKRRLKIPSSGMTVGLDQIPEALLPALVARCVLPLTSLDIAAIVSIFFVAATLFLPHLFRAEDSGSTSLGPLVGAAQSVKRDFGRTIEPHRRNARTGADRRIAGHVPVFPCAGAESAW